MLSVCIATYNGEKYIYRQLESILSQLNKFDEIIISDDNSTDKTLKIISEFNDSRIKVINNSHIVDYSNKRLSSYYKATYNFYNAIKYAAGDIIFFSDQDDIWYPNKVFKTTFLMQDYDLVLSNFSVIDERDTLKIERYQTGNPLSNQSLVKLVMKMPFRGCCLAVKREIIKDAMPFPVGVFMHDNWIGLIAKLKGYNIIYVDDPLIKYRRHNENVSDMNSPNSFLFKVYYRLVFLFKLYNHIYSRKS